LFIKIFINNNKPRWNQIEKIAANNNIQSRFWIFKLVSRREYELVFSFYQEIKLVLERIRDNKRWARVIWIELPPSNFHDYELNGIIEFDSPHSLNWVQENICFRADWDILALPPNVWIHRFEDNLKRNHVKFRYEINNGPYPY
jgi:hypothetical protein